MSRLAGEPLARTFGVIGLCVAILASVLDPPRDLHLSGVSFAIACAAVLGAVVGRLRARGYVIAVSVLAGWLVGLGIAPYWVTFEAGRNIALACLVIPGAILALAFVGRRVGRATPFSVLDRSSRRALFAAASAVIASASWATIAAGTNEAFVPLIMGTGAFVTAALMLFSDVRVSLLVRKAHDAIDFGAGVRSVERRDEVPASYRTTAVVVRVEHHARTHALRWIARVLAVETIAVVIAATSFAFATRGAMAIEKPRSTPPAHVAYVEQQPPRPCRKR
jgi:hypothetical protein